ncbi:hypothetical protein GCM10010946_34480 [Undibacterium squillarum]|uniref:Uncharacterized protein n=2 Tax=Undibacterium squillarum TaxID=1131567 RepID=A0ABQ2Y3X7_9BURK|nr:hypothetical protein GCM10010946_34480 [Undibacterium squillarum]
MPATGVLRTKKKILTTKVEGTYGSDAAPGVVDAIMVTNLDLSPLEVEAQERGQVQPYFGNTEDIIAAAYVKLSFDVEVSGSGAAGTVPQLGKLLRACSMSETIMAAPVTGVASAGGSVTQMPLAAGASAVDGAYVGMTINLTGGTGAGQSAVIKSYTGATKTAVFTAPLATAPDATTQYTIPAQVVYRRITDNPESVTHYVNIDGVLHKMLGVRGTVSFSFSNKKVPTAKFSMTGLFAQVVDAPAGQASYAGKTPPVAVNAINTRNTRLHDFFGAVVSDLSIDVANDITFRTLGGGTEQVLITDSKPTGSITQQATKMADKDWYTAIKNAAVGALSITHGTVAGNIVKIDAPRVQLTKPQLSDMDNIVMLQTGLKLLPDLGNDELTISFM